tara:strand:- start:18852 stop:19424 length:573 start_codon:yes stop_codon:yes gene_type:complete
MKRKLNFVVMGLVLMGSSAAHAADDICKKIAKFESAGFDGTENPEGRRWIELQWRGVWLVEWGFDCSNSGDQVAKDLCSWLVNGNVSFEFQSMLPRRILQCYGHKFPPNVSWREWNSEIDLWRSDRLSILEIKFGGTQPGDGAIRFSTFADNKDDVLAELPPVGSPTPNTVMPTPIAREVEMIFENGDKE